MKVVINSDYGGFGLSQQAMQYIADRKGWHYHIEDNGAGWWHTPPNSHENAVFGHQIWDVDIPRTDPDLVECVEELRDNSWGYNAELKVVSIPDNIYWHIQDYDGKEWVAEDHRVWM